MQKIAKKFVEVMKECSHVAKNGTNDYHKYKYVTAADVLEKVNASLTKYGLATVEVTVTLIDAESGETLTLKGLGSGQDSSDKSVAKAQTMGIKYAYLSSIAIATSDDPEADSRTDEVMQCQLPHVKNNADNNPTCKDCGSAITQRVADYSKNKFGRFLCLDCQRQKQSVA